MTAEAIGNDDTAAGVSETPAIEDSLHGPELLPPAVSESTRESVDYVVTKAEHVVDVRLKRLQEKGIIDADSGKRRQRILKMLETRQRI